MLHTFSYIWDLGWKTFANKRRSGDCLREDICKEAVRRGQEEEGSKEMGMTKVGLSDCMKWILCGWRWPGKAIVCTVCKRTLLCLSFTSHSIPCYPRQTLLYHLHIPLRNCEAWCGLFFYACISFCCLGACSLLCCCCLKLYVLNKVNPSFGILQPCSLF